MRLTEKKLILAVVSAAVIGIAVSGCGNTANDVVGPATTTDQSSSPVDDVELGVVTTTSMGIAESLQWESAADPEYRKKAIALVSSWIAEVNSGTAVNLQAASGDDSPAPLELNEANQLLASLQEGIEPTPQVAPASAATPPASQEGNPFKQNLTALNPNAFPVRGNKFGTTAWRNLRYRIDYHDCSKSGCPVTQYYQSTLTVDPNSKTSRISSQSVHWMKSVDRMNGIHFQNYAVVRGKTVNNPDASNVNLPDKGGPLIFYVTTPMNLQGNVLTQAPALWIKINGTWRYEGAKTADATCRRDAKKPNANLVCTY
jgi:hypothetical protein